MAPRISLDSDDDQVFCNPVMRIMRSEPDFVAGELLQREFIVEESSISVLVEIAVSAAPLVDLILISVSIIELVSEQLIGYSCCPILPASIGLSRKAGAWYNTLQKRTA